MYVNLYTPSKVEWNGLSINQQTTYPGSNETEFILKFIGSPAGNTFINFRNPAWAKSIPVVLVNGKAVKTALVNNWMQLQRKWKDGDKIKIIFPMNLYADRLDESKPFPAAIMYGPVTMASNVITDYPTDFVTENNISSNFTLINGKPLHYQIKNHPDLTLRPYYQYAINEPYVLYFDPAVRNVIPKKNWTLTGNWQRAKGPYFTNDGSVSADFTGKGIVVYFSSFPNSGIVKVEIDGKEAEKVNTYTAETGGRDLIKTYNLSGGKHNVNVSVTGKKDLQSKNTFLNISKFEVIE